MRVALLELNGIAAPIPTYTGEIHEYGEYVHPAAPTGAPWERVTDWPSAEVALGVGDFAVFAVQYRLGDGETWVSYPEIITRCMAVHLRLRVPQTTAPPGRAATEWMPEVKRELAQPILFMPADRRTDSFAIWDWE
jgi:hypothetical protein